MKPKRKNGYWILKAPVEKPNKVILPSNLYNRKREKTALRREIQGY
jgi:hypothetical protein